MKDSWIWESASSEHWKKLFLFQAGEEKPEPCKSGGFRTSVLNSGFGDPRCSGLCGTAVSVSRDSFGRKKKPDFDLQLKHAIFILKFNIFKQN